MFRPEYRLVRLNVCVYNVGASYLESGSVSVGALYLRSSFGVVRAYYLK